MSAATDTPAYTNRHPRPVVFEVRGYRRVRLAPGEREAVDYEPPPHSDGWYLVLCAGGTFLELGRVRELAGS